MRRRRRRKYPAALDAITQRMRPLKCDAVHQAIGAAKKEAGRDARFVTISVQHHVRGKDKGNGKDKSETATLTYKLDRQKLREARRREGRYLLRTNLTEEDPAKLWEYYLQLTEVEQAFKELKGDLALRPIHHQLDHRIEAHMMIQSPPHGSFTPAGLLLRRSLSRPIPGGLGSSPSLPAPCKSPSRPG